MGRTLFTIAFLVDADEEQRAELVTLLERSVTLNMLATLDRNDADFEDLESTGFEFYGISVLPIRESV